LKIVALDTSSLRGSVALLNGCEVCAQLQLSSMETHSARLLASLEFLLKNSGWNLRELGLVVAGIGPGSFTGIRIGVSTALGLAQTLSIPFAGISALDALAYLLRDHEGRIGVVIDAQRAQVYHAEYRCCRGKIARLGTPALLEPRALQFERKGKGMFLVGDGAMRYARVWKIGAQGWPRLVSTDLFLAAPMARLALARRQIWRTGDSIYPKPLYIRPPDAQKRKAARS
jgi:tRNA threonylcarbamoyladenosine biosynthesis protein TsaB